MKDAIPERLNILNLICDNITTFQGWGRKTVVSIILQTISWLHQRCDTIYIGVYIFHKKLLRWTKCERADEELIIFTAILEGG